MATLSTTLSLSSSTATSDAISLSLTQSLNITNPVRGLSRESVLHNADTVIVAASIAAPTYVYLKNMDSGNLVYLKTDAAGEDAFARLYPGETILFCVAPSTGLHLRADTAACIVEYAAFTKE